MNLNNKDRTKIEADLVLALEPVWRMEKEEQKVFLEAFINKTMQRANFLHEPVQFIERVE
jgi:hypothetical protein